MIRHLLESLGGGRLPSNGTMIGSLDWVWILISSLKSRKESGLKRMA